MDSLRIPSQLRGTLELAEHRIEKYPDQREIGRICLRFALRLQSRLSQMIIQHLGMNDLKSVVRLEVNVSRNEEALT